MKGNITNDNSAIKQKRQRLIAKTMLISIITAIVILLIGEILYLYSYERIIHLPHIFKGEPKQLENVPLMFSSAFSGNIQSIVQVGIFLLLINPIIRVLITAYEFISEKNKLYTAISLLVLCVLLGSFLIPAILVKF
ncbi:DUF1634 domain-containing protein [Thiotrichales bacterium 19S3-7]|nr:DUF1634 domain-containing protein [Thiotrichales bacterium 19S3-7]MCF6802959.1 DUF1634 domain-containing protein [Thiotrichales bacterium 19S3-11]